MLVHVCQTKGNVFFAFGTARLCFSNIIQFKCSVPASCLSIIDFSITKYDFLLLTSLSTCNPCSEFTYHMQVPSRSYESFLKIFSFNTIFFVTVRCIKSTGSIIWDMMKKSEMRCIYYVNDSKAYWYFNYLEERNNSYLILGLVLALCFCFEST